MEIELSIIMPSLNVAKYIEECMDSALNQSLKKIEILCIDAGSTDGTWEILKKYESLPIAGRVIRCIHSDRKSYGYQINLGIKLAKGSYIAVLETDDYVDKQMYEQLLNLAKAQDLDVVKADYDYFYTLQNGERYYRRVALWNDRFNRYNTVINPKKDDYLYANDYNIWKGIYRKKFLTENNIWLNETQGAAFQDIGFAQQVLACAERVYYSDLSFYRYRVDRETSSTNSSRGLSYSRQEFSRLISEPDINKKLVCKQGLYRHMAQSFKWEYRKLVISSECSVHLKELQNDYEWFRETLTEAIRQSDFDLRKLPTDDREELEFLLNDCRGYAKQLYEQEKKQNEKRNNLLAKVGKKGVVVFGAGKIGHTVVRIFLENGIEPIWVFDNNRSMWGKTLYGIPVSMPIKPAKNILVVIANKISGEEIKKQLIDMGISQEQIIFGEV